MNVYKVVKRILDIYFSLMLLLLLLPVMIFICVLIKLETSGSAIFKQERPGKHTKIFTIYKFRTMQVEYELDGVLLSDVERITRVGSFLRKTSLDELPQLLNVLKGDMSFIGPRPLLVRYLELYSENEMRRHDVAPGITGLAQVKGRNSISWDEKFRYDIEYIEKQSFLLDLKILILTLYCVIRKKGVNKSQVETMPIFKGNTKYHSNT